MTPAIWLECWGPGWEWHDCVGVPIPNTRWGNVTLNPMTGKRVELTWTATTTTSSSYDTNNKKHNQDTFVGTADSQNNKHNQNTFAGSTDSTPFPSPSSSAAEPSLDILSDYNPSNSLPPNMSPYGGRTIGGLADVGAAGSKADADLAGDASRQPK